MCTVIEEKEVTPVNLSLELERAVIRHVLEEDRDIYVTESSWFPFWVRVYRGSGQVVLTTHTNFRSATTMVQRLELANEINSGYVMVNAYVKEQRLRIDHCLICRDGMTRESFIRACRVFNDSITRALAAFDPDNSLLLPPGESEDSDQAQAQGPQ